MAREPTKSAQAAKMIRQALTAQGLTVRVKSRNFSMGDAVDVFMTDQRPEVMKLVRAYCGKFQSGSDKSDLPRAKYVHVSNSMSDEMRETVYQWVRANWFGGENLPATYADGGEQTLDGEWVSQRCYRLFTSEESPFWKNLKQRAA